MSTVHISPIDDWIEHEFSDDCVCGPQHEFITGGIGLAVHSALDGRPEFAFTLVEERDCDDITLMTGDYDHAGWEAFDPQQEISIRDRS